MWKKIIIPIILVLFLAGTSFFYWWNNQKDVRELNKGLPNGVKVVKSLIGKEYKVVNKIDGYEFKVPKEWEGVDNIKYIPESLEESNKITSININILGGSSVAIDRFKLEEDLDLKSSAQKIFTDFELVGEFDEDNIKNTKILKTQEKVHLLGDYVYFFKKESIVYSITSASEESIRYIISNGKW